MMKEKRISDEHKRIEMIIHPIAMKYGVDTVSLFGSRARGDYVRESDYDFLISRGEIDTIVSHMQFVYDLEDALGGHVDVVTDDIDDSEFLDIIKRDEVNLYERKR